MINFLRNLSIKLTGRRPFYNKIIFINALKRSIRAKQPNKYLFVFCPLYCGSTLLSEVFLRSKNVSGNNYLGTKEGQTLPLVKDIMFGPDRFDEKAIFDWQFIKKEWLKYWDVTKPVLFEKSPENIFRINDLMENFTPFYAVIMVRNPYAQCESLIRRDKLSAKDAAELAIKCLRFQAKNESLLEKKFVTRYEDFVADPSNILTTISEEISELSDITLDGGFTSHNHYEKDSSISNVNQKKIDSLSDDEMTDIKAVFTKNADALEYWGYELI